MFYIFKTISLMTSGKQAALRLRACSPVRFFHTAWLKLLLSIQRTDSHQARVRTISAQEWCSTKQLLLEQKRYDIHAHLLAPGNAVPQSLRAGLAPLLPHMPDAPPLHPGDLFRAYVSSPAHYRPRYPSIASPLNQHSSMSVPRSNGFPAWLVEEKDRSSLFALTEEDMRPERGEKREEAIKVSTLDQGKEEQEETIKVPALYQLHVFLRDHKDAAPSGLKQKIPGR